MFRREPTSNSVVRKELIGAGSFGSVYSGDWTPSPASPLSSQVDRSTTNKFQTKENVAIKVIQYSGNGLNSLRRELYFLRNFKSPFIVQYYDSFLYKFELWIIMELCDAGSLLDLYRVTNSVLNEPELRAVIACSVLGLGYVHNQQSIHRDIKAGNILLSGMGKAMLSDFGISTKLTDSDSKNRRKTVVGTPYWMAPEILLETAYGENVDVWSLGITVLELCEGRPPHSGVKPISAMFMISYKPAPLLAEPERWSLQMQAFVSRCLVKDPTSRAQTRELAEHDWLQAEVGQLRSSQAAGEACSLHVLRELVKRHWDAITARRQKIDDDCYVDPNANTMNDAHRQGGLYECDTEPWDDIAASGLEYNTYTDTDAGDNTDTWREYTGTDAAGTVPETCAILRDRLNSDDPNSDDVESTGSWSTSDFRASRSEAAGAVHAPTAIQMLISPTRYNRDRRDKERKGINGETNDHIINYNEMNTRTGTRTGDTGDWASTWRSYRNSQTQVQHDQQRVSSTATFVQLPHQYHSAHGTPVKSAITATTPSTTLSKSKPPVEYDTNQSNINTLTIPPNSATAITPRRVQRGVSEYNTSSSTSTGKWSARTRNHNQKHSHTHTHSNNRTFQQPTHPSSSSSAHRRLIDSTDTTPRAAQNELTRTYSLSHSNLSSLADQHTLNNDTRKTSNKSSPYKSQGHPKSDNTYDYCNNTFNSVHNYANYDNDEEPKSLLKLRVGKEPSNLTAANEVAEDVDVNKVKDYNKYTDRGRDGDRETDSESTPLYRDDSVCSTDDTVELGELAQREAWDQESEQDTVELGRTDGRLSRVLFEEGLRLGMVPAQEQEHGDEKTSGLNQSDTQNFTGRAVEMDGEEYDAAKVLNTPAVADSTLPQLNTISDLTLQTPVKTMGSRVPILTLLAPDELSVSGAHTTTETSPDYIPPQSPPLQMNLGSHSRSGSSRTSRGSSAQSTPRKSRLSIPSLLSVKDMSNCTDSGYKNFYSRDGKNGSGSPGTESDAGQGGGSSARLCHVAVHGQGGSPRVTGDNPMAPSSSSSSTVPQDMVIGASSGRPTSSSAGRNRSSSNSSSPSKLISSFTSILSFGISPDDPTISSPSHEFDTVTTKYANIRAIDTDCATEPQSQPPTQATTLPDLSGPGQGPATRRNPTWFQCLLRMFCDCCTMHTESEHGGSPHNHPAQGRSFQ